MVFGKKDKKKVRKKEINNRLYVIMAIIFLLVGSVIARLYNLQVSKYDLYIALASDQHQVYNKLEAKRGRIFMQDNKNSTDNELYPVATNKDFALAYAIPKEVENPEELAVKLYEIFDKNEVEKEVDKLLEGDDYFLGVQISLDESEEKKKEIEEFKKVKRDLEIEVRQKKIIDAYKEKLTKKNDPYEPIRKKITDEQLEQVKNLNMPGIDFIMEKHRFYPEGNVGSQVLGFVGFTDKGQTGRYGLEGFFNEELSGRGGAIRTERSAGGELIIINDREYSKPLDGSDLVLTINRSIQFMACNKLSEEASRHGADGGSVVVMDPSTGAILAMCSWPDYDPNNYADIEDANVYNNPAIFDQYEPGSIFKVITMAAGVDSGKITPETFYQDNGYINIEGWPKPIKNSDYETAGAHGWVNMITVLEKSLNTGSIFAMLQTGVGEFGQYVERFGFGEKTGIELETEVEGNINSLRAKNVRPVEAATASFGQGITVTPLQITSAFAAIVNGGILMQPYLVKEIITPSGNKIETQPREIRRVISERAALLVSGMMVRVVDDGHAKLAKVDGYFIGGKTGTAQVADKEKKGYGDKTIHTFVGFGPVDDPKFVMLVKLDDPKDMEFAASSVTPIFGQIAEFILNYYQVPKER